MTGPIFRRFRIVDTFPYLDREDEYSDLTLDEAVARMDDLTGVGADVILSDLDSDGLDVLPWKWVDDETGREVALRLEVEPPPQPEAGGMSLADGLGADPAHEVGGTTHRPDQPQIPEAAKSAAYEALGIGDNPRLKRESTAARINERTRVDVALKAALPAILQANAKFAEREYERVCEERDALRAERDRSVEHLAECYRLTGADSDGDSDSMLAAEAVEEVARMRKELDQAEAKLAQVQEWAEQMKFPETEGWVQSLFTILNDSDSTEVDNG